jgi:hypothetical protein
LLPATDLLFEEVLQHLRVRKGIPKVDGQLKHTIARAEMSTAVGLAHFAVDNVEGELGTAGSEGWKQRVRSILTLFGGK